MYTLSEIFIPLVTIQKKVHFIAFWRKEHFRPGPVQIWTFSNRIKVSEIINRILKSLPIVRQPIRFLMWICSEVVQKKSKRL